MKRRFLPIFACHCVDRAACCAAQSQTAERAPDTMAARVLACASCHGAEGEGTSDVYFPRLAGKPAGYLYNQLVAFRDGRRKYPPMNYLLGLSARRLSETDRRAFCVAAPAIPAAGDPNRQQRNSGAGRSARHAGRPAARHPALRQLPRSSLGGMEPAIPGLLGLRASYISAQLGGWRYGTRTAIAPDCMQIVAGLLTEDDVKAVAACAVVAPGANGSVVRRARQPADAAVHAAASRNRRACR